MSSAFQTPPVLILPPPEPHQQVLMYDLFRSYPSRTMMFANEYHQASPVSTISSTSFSEDFERSIHDVINSNLISFIRPKIDLDEFDFHRIGRQSGKQQSTCLMMDYVTRDVGGVIEFPPSKRSLAYVLITAAIDKAY